MSQEDSTIKLVIKLQDDQLVESVIIRHSDDMPRNTLCVSSQVQRGPVWRVGSLQGVCGRLDVQWGANSVRLVL